MLHEYITNSRPIYTCICSSRVRFQSDSPVVVDHARDGDAVVAGDAQVADAPILKSVLKRPAPATDRASEEGKFRAVLDKITPLLASPGDGATLM